jgi:hypothetical protein
MAESGRDEPLLGVLVGAVQRDRGHVPVQPRHLQAKGSDRLRADRPHQLVELGRDGVQGTADAVVVERCRLDPEDLLHRPRPRPVLHPPQRGRGGQPVGHQDLDHLPMGQGGHLANRAGPIHDALQVKALTEVGHHWQRPQRLLAAGRAVAGAPPRSSSCLLSRHRGMLADPKPRQHNKSGMFRSITTPHPRMCEGRDW